MSRDAIDELAALYKSSPDDDEAYMRGFKDAKAGKKPAPQAAASEGDEGDGEAPGEAALGDDEEGEGEAVPGDEAAPGEAAPGGDEEGEGEAPFGADETGDEPGDEPEGEPGDEETPEGEPGEEPGELPEDDGDNHGVGDLDGDGQTQSLIQEVANLERAFYATKGLHGAGNKVEAALTTYHRAVRKLVRALMSKPSEAPPAEGAEGQDSPPEKKKAPPFGKSLDPLTVLVLEHGEPADVRPVLARLVKAAAGPSVRKGALDYLVNYVKSAGELAKNELSDPDASTLAQHVMSQMIDRFTIDGSLRAAAADYNITMEGVEAILRQTGLIGAPAIDDPSITRDEESHAAMGVGKSMDFSGASVGVGDNLLAKGAEGVKLTPRVAPRLELPDDVGDVGARFRKSAEAERRARVFRDSELHVTRDVACPFHGAGHDAVYKSRLLQPGYLRCTCPSK